MDDMTPGHRPNHTAGRRLLGWAAALLALTLLATAWTWTPLREWIRPEQLAARLDALSGHPAAPLVVFGGFLLGGLLVLPVTVMVVLTVSAFGPVGGFLYALAGATMSALLSFAIGRLAGRRQIERLAGSRVHRISQRLGDSGVIAVTALRMMPVTHFTVVSLTAGSTHIRWRDFLLGTVLGMAPGIAAIALFFDRFAATAREPSVAQFAAFVAVSAGILAVLALLRRWAHRRGRF